jgi:DNA polymerase-3 subunit delta'
MWDTVLGHEENKAFLRTLLTEPRKTPSLLFYGSEGIGKRTLALQFAKSFLCLEDPLAEHCHCASCARFDMALESLRERQESDEKETQEDQSLCKTGHFDFYYVQPVSPSNLVLIGQIKNVAAQATYAPTLSRYKVCLIDGADRMNPEAANAFLKLLEEPPEYWLFILIASNKNRLLPTIQSRVMALRFQPLTEEETAEVMEMRHVPNGEIFASLTDGSPGKALSLSQADALMWRERVLTVLEQLDEGYLMLRLADLDWLGKIQREDAATCVEMMLLLFRDGLMRCDPDLPLYNKDIGGRVMECFRNWPDARLRRAYDITEEYWQGLQSYLGGEMMLTSLFLEIKRTNKEF